MRQCTARQYLNAAVIAAGVSALLAACSSSTPDKATPASSKASAAATGDTATTATVGLKLLQFTPAALTVKAGTTVTWRSAENITHTVTSGTYAGTNNASGLRTSQKPNGLFNSTLAKTGTTATYRFAKSGTYPYYCDIHQGMNARVVVTP